MRSAIAAFVILGLALAISPQFAQAKASLSGDTINIWSSGSAQWVDTCATLLTDVPTHVKACSSPFAATCISVNATINITRGGATNRTNFTIDGCELRFNLTDYLEYGMTSWGNLTIKSANITTQDHNSPFTSSSYTTFITAKPNSNFSLTNSFLDMMGLDGTVEGQRGLEVYTPVYNIRNNTMTQSCSGITLYNGANGSVIGSSYITNSICYDSFGVFLFGVGNMSVENITVSNLQPFIASTANGIYVLNSRNISVKNINISKNFIYGVNIEGSHNVSLYNITTEFSVLGGMIFVNSFNNTLNLARLYDSVISLGFSGSDNNTIRNLNATKSTECEIQLVGSSSWNFFENSILNNSGFAPNIADVELADSFDYSNNNTFLNVSYAKDDTGFSYGSIDRMWYVDINVQDDSLLSIDAVNVSTFNANNVTINYTYTNATGDLRKKVVMAYTDMYVGIGLGDRTKIYNTTYYTIVAWKSGYNKAVSIQNFTDPNYVNRKILFTLTPDADVPVVSNFVRNPLCLEAGQTINYTFDLQDLGSDIQSYSCNFTSPVTVSYNSTTTLGKSYLTYLPSPTYSVYCNMSVDLTGDWRLNMYAIDRSGNTKIISYFFLSRDIGSCTLGGTGGGGSVDGSGGAGGWSSSTVIVTNATFSVDPRDITKLSSIGEHSLIQSSIFGSHTLAIRNEGTSTIRVSVTPQGDYRSFITLSSVALMQAMTVQESTIEIPAGKTANVDLYTNIPLTTKEGNYQIVVALVDTDTKAYRSVIITLTVSPLTTFTKLAGTAFQAFEKALTFNTTAHGITKNDREIVVASIANFSIPFFGSGAIIFSAIVVYYLSKKSTSGLSGRLQKAARPYINYGLAFVAAVLVVVLI